MTSDDPAILFPQIPITSDPTVSFPNVFFLAERMIELFSPDSYFGLHRKVTWFHLPSYNSLVCQWEARADGAEPQRSFNTDSPCSLVRISYIYE